ncbi:MAG: PAS domain S-box protein [Candidatus Omnitrophica bacterium]|nr:PAS domain S-box protein [Candidatus Omnitrophota bacterium]
MADEKKRTKNGKEILGHDEAAELFKESNALYRAILDNLQDAVYILDANGRFLLWNSVFNKVTGCSDEEISSKVPTDFIVPGDRSILAAAITEVWETGFAKAEVGVIAKDGSCAIYEFASSLLKDSSGRIVGLCGSGRDTTLRKKTLDELQDKIGQLKIFAKAATGREMRMIELKEKVRELEERLKVKGSFQK